MIIRIGKASDNDFVVNDPHVSRYHAKLIREEGGCWLLEDLGSTNGTFVNGAQIVKKHVTPSDTIKLGDNYVLKVNNKKIGEYVPKELSFKYTPGMNLTEAQRREFTESMKGRRGSIYTLQVKEGETYQIALDYKSGKEGSVSHLSVDMYERKLAVFEELKEKIREEESKK